MKAHKGFTRWLGPLGNCDFCERPLKGFPKFYDAKTQLGPWALMCPDCYAHYGIGLGLGRGQEYATDTRLKLRG